jgi:DNA polymerase-3 subunit gamma/tau
MADDHYLVLARRWRPQKFDDVIGQEHITRTLQNALRSGRIHHAYLFVGSRGIGKTTSARILARCLNCLSSEGPTPEPCGECANCRSIAAGTNLDVLEIDGASNNSVEDVRQIRDNVRMVPSGSRYKIYVIDEVHQLSAAAFNALLKTLEEPPAHAVFILATTEAHKIPATIISRCQRLDFRRVGLKELIALLTRIVVAEKRTATDDALYAIARAADGGVRDAESILDQLFSYCDAEITYPDVYSVLGLVDWRVLHELCDALSREDVVRLLTIVEEVVVHGKDLSQFAQEILRYFRNLLVLRSGGPAELLALPDDEVAEMRERAGRFTLMQLVRLVEQFAELATGFDSQLAQRTALEALLIRVSKRSVEVSVESVLEKLALLREGGAPMAAVAPTVTPAAPAPEPMRENAPAAPVKKKSEVKPEPPQATPDFSRPPAVPAVKTDRAPGNGGVSARPAARAASTPGVTPEDAQALLGDPHVQQVVKVFKGKIVDVKSVPAAAPRTPESE